MRLRSERQVLVAVLIVSLVAVAAGLVMDLPGLWGAGLGLAGLFALAWAFDWDLPSF